MSDFAKRLAAAQVVAVVCNQWGDSGKGKIIDHLAHGFDIIARGTGGNNAGHTVKVGGQQYVFNLIPSGILYDREGKSSILGNGMVIDLSGLVRELRMLDAAGLSYKHLLVSKDAALVVPWEVERDRERNQSARSIGSTGRGIGEAYGDKVTRKGIYIADLFDREHLKKRLLALQRHYPDSKLSLAEVSEELLSALNGVRAHIGDTKAFIQQAHKDGKRILLEGAQGLLLSIEHGTRPFVTSSDPSVTGTLAGVGLAFDAVDVALGLVKFPYMTRVGAGPFPSELGGTASEEYFAQESGNRQPDEKAKHPSPLEMANHGTDFEKGIGLRMLGNEYGATTGRPRRTGWTDLVALRHAISMNGPDIVLMKPDVATGISEIKLCTAYRWEGADGYDSPYGKLQKGQIINVFAQEEQVLRHCAPELRSFPGWKENIRGVRTQEELPAQLLEQVRFLEEQTGARVRMISVGPEREQIVHMDE